MRLQGQRGLGGDLGEEEGGRHDLATHTITIKWSIAWDWRGGLRGTACNWAFFFVCMEAG